ncbi:1553_t:CDS:10 [Acaulospora morrowiae]|uniref:Dolichyl-phosphate-mannose--protein mannosyltransferase n=1 Tax=Acaulospora morrowiae TaxID=94023 RepID=A0A9N8YWD7_9GLOM|nr:1553_t:CDS:10 [Acaulospora morrowiae]
MEYRLGKEESIYSDVRNRKAKQEYREYDSSENDIGENLKGKKVKKSFLRISTRDMYYLCGLIVVAIAVRAYKLEQPSSVVFDEVHFGGFARKYIKGQFFMDVHPPLAKMLFALAGVLGGFDGNFDFKEIGKDYLEPKVPYITMRLFPAITGIFVIPISYMTIKLAGFSTISAFMVATLLIFENGLVTQSRLILLDSPLIASTAFTVLMWVKFQNEQKRPFRFWWWVWMAMTGVGLGLTVSMKWVGLFTIAFVGLSTIKGLWELLGDVNVKPYEWAKHFFARALCLIVIPVSLYMFFFVIHFAILQNGGDGEGFMSAEFKMTLNGYSQKDTPIDVAFGSAVTIKHLNTHGGYLHSHSHNYPTGSKQQQVTLYPHIDENNLWFIDNHTSPEIPFNESSPKWITHNTIIRLNHIATNRRLHSHNVRPPMTDEDYHNEVSAYGYEGFGGDANDHWGVEIYDHDKSDPESGKRLRAINTKFRLRHMMTGCYLFSTSIKLPEWGFEQQQVSCIHDGTIPNTLWYIESNSNPSLPNDTELVNYKKPGFFKKFLELNKVMWNINKGLTDSHPFESRPNDWVVLNRGISFWQKDRRQIYLIGNPLIWWSSSMAIILFLALKAIIIIRSKRGYSDHLNVDKEHFESWAGLFFMGWCLHYFPFYLMARQLFLHHYFPSLYFAILLIGVGFDLFTFRLSPYGNPWIKSDCKSMKWVDTWDFDCTSNFDTYEEYYKINKDVFIEHPTPREEIGGQAVLNPDAEEEEIPRDEDVSTNLVTEFTEFKLRHKNDDATKVDLASDKIEKSVQPDTPVESHPSHEESEKEDIVSSEKVSDPPIVSGPDHENFSKAENEEKDEDSTKNV